MVNLFPSTAGFTTQPNSGLFNQFLHNQNEAHLPCPDPISYEAMIKIFTFYFYFFRKAKTKKTPKISPTKQSQHRRMHI